MSRSRGGLIIPRPNAAGRAERPKPPSVVREVHTQIHLVGEAQPAPSEVRPTARANPIHIPSSQPTMKLAALRLDPIGAPTTRAVAPSRAPSSHAPSSQAPSSHAPPRRSGIVPARGRMPALPPAPPLPREARRTRSMPPPPPPRAAAPTAAAPTAGLDRALAQAQTFARPIPIPSPAVPLASRPAPPAPSSFVAAPVSHAALTEEDLALFESPFARLWRRLRALFSKGA